MKEPKKKKKKLDYWDVDEGSDYPIHEPYTQEELVKK